MKFNCPECGEERERFVVICQERDKLKRELESLRTRVAELEWRLVIATHRIADDFESNEYPYCLECESKWPCATFQSAEKARAAAAKGGE